MAQGPLNKINPLLIYCENTAFGRQGPDANRPGYDIIIQAMSGLMASEGKLSGESPEHIWSSPMVDTTAGFCLAWSICGALFARERTGKGHGFNAPRKPDITSGIHGFYLQKGYRRIIISHETSWNIF